MKLNLFTLQSEVVKPVIGPVTMSITGFQGKKIFFQIFAIKIRNIDHCEVAIYLVTIIQ